MGEAVIESLVALVIGLSAVLAAWDIGRKNIAAKIAAQPAPVDAPALEELRSKLDDVEKRCAAAEKTAHDTKNRLELAAAAANKARARWDSSRPVKIG